MTLADSMANASFPYTKLYTIVYCIYIYIHTDEYIYIYVCVYTDTCIYIVELRTPATPVGVGGGKERGGCHLNLRT